MKKIPTEVIVIWSRSPAAVDEGFINVLSYGGGAPRVFEQDKLDSRCGEVPCFSTLEDAKVYLRANPGPTKGCQLPVREAAAWGLL